MFIKGWFKRQKNAKIQTGKDNEYFNFLSGDLPSEEKALCLMIKPLVYICF